MGPRDVVGMTLGATEALENGGLLDWNGYWPIVEDGHITGVVAVGEMIPEADTTLWFDPAKDYYRRDAGSPEELDVIVEATKYCPHCGALAHRVIAAEGGVICPACRHKFRRA